MQIHHTHVNLLYALISYIVLSNAVNSMPTPDGKSTPFYKWFFTFSHGILMQAGRFVSDYIKNGQNGLQTEAEVQVTNQAQKGA